MRIILLWIPLSSRRMTPMEGAAFRCIFTLKKVVLRAKYGCFLDDYKTKSG